MGVNKVDDNLNALTGAKFVLSESALGTVPTWDDTTGLSTTTGLIALVADGTDYRVATTAQIADNTVTKVYSIDAGNSTIKGLDDATTYYLYEVKAPSGYNLLTEPVTFTISASYNADGSALAASNPTVVVGTQAVSTTLSTNVINEEGTTLPSTGGIGTTIFYVIGAILVLGAGILLVTRRRVSAN